MNSLNRATLIGNVGDTPKLYQANGGQNTIASFSMATTEQGYTTPTGEQIPDRTEWHNVVCYDPLASKVVAKYVTKGTKLYIAGKLRTRSYDKDGIKRYTTNIVADELIMLDNRKSNQPTEAAPTEQPLYGANDDIPF